MRSCNARWSTYPKISAHNSRGSCTWVSRNNGFAGSGDANRVSGDGDRRAGDERQDSDWEDRAAVDDESLERGDEGGRISRENDKDSAKDESPSRDRYIVETREFNVYSTYDRHCQCLQYRIPPSPVPRVLRDRPSATVGPRPSSFFAS